MDKVKVKSLVGGTVFIKDPGSNLRVTWDRKGQVRLIDKEALEQAIYNPGVEYMFREGMLGIVDEDAFQTKVDLGLEIEGEEERIILFTDERAEELLALPLGKFRQEVKSLSREQLFEFTNYCIENEKVDFEKAEILRAYTGINILEAVRLQRLDREKVEVKEESNDFRTGGL